MNNDYICANTLEGVGTLSELNINFIKDDYENTIIKGVMVVEINNQPLLSHIYISSANKYKYYNFIRFLGLRYEYISKVDNQPYTLSNPPIQCYHGAIKVNYKNVLDIESTKPNKVYFVGRLASEKSISINHIIPTDSDDYLSGHIQGVYLSTEGFLSIYDNYQQILPLSYKNANLTPNNAYSIEILGIDKCGVMVGDIKECGRIYSDDFIAFNKKQYELNQRAKSQKRQKK